MPDPRRETVSASQVAALFDASDYATRWMLWQCFAGLADIEPREDQRMRIGKALESSIAWLAAEDQKLDIRTNATAEYYRRGPLGCTPDTHVFTCPTRGDGVVETKNVDWLVYKQKWKFDEAGAPVGATDYIELQVQAQLYVLDVQWGLIAALVGGNELVYLERRRDNSVCARLVEEAEAFLASVREGREPSPLGVGIELPVLSQLYPTAAEELELDLSGDRTEEGLAVEEWAQELATASWLRREQQKRVERYRAQLLALSGPHGRLRTPGGMVYISPQKRSIKFQEAS